MSKNGIIEYLEIDQLDFQKMSLTQRYLSDKNQTVFLFLANLEIVKLKYMCHKVAFVFRHYIVILQ